MSIEEPDALEELANASSDEGPRAHVPTELTAPKRGLGVLRNVAIIIGLNILGYLGVAFYVQLSGPNFGSGTFIRDTLILFGLSIVIMSSLGFTIAGCLGRRDRWKHVSCAAGAIWFLAFTTLCANHISFHDFDWVKPFFINQSIALLLIFLPMLIGTGISWLLKGWTDKEWK